MQRFSRTISQVIFGYANETRRVFGHVGDHDRICAILMNNIQQLRLNLEKFHKHLGGEQLDDETKSRLKELQDQLSDVLDELSAMYIKSIQPTIRQAVEEVNKRLQQLEGNQMHPGNNSAPQEEVDALPVTQPLMKYLDER